MWVFLVPSMHLKKIKTKQNKETSLCVCLPVCLSGEKNLKNRHTDRQRGTHILYFSGFSLFLLYFLFVFLFFMFYVLVFFFFFCPFFFSFFLYFCIFSSFFHNKNTLSFFFSFFLYFCIFSPFSIINTHSFFFSFFLYFCIFFFLFP